MFVLAQCSIWLSPVALTPRFQNDVTEKCEEELPNERTDETIELHDLPNERRKVRRAINPPLNLLNM